MGSGIVNGGPLEGRTHGTVQTLQPLELDLGLVGGQRARSTIGPSVSSHGGASTLNQEKFECSQTLVSRRPEGSDKLGGKARIERPAFRRFADPKRNPSALSEAL